MGCFGYICPVCKTSIRGDCFDGGEKCILIHKRHGVEIGRTEGHYGEYGNVIEDEAFRSCDIDGPNSHDEICESEMYLKDSMSFGYKRVAKNNKEYRIDSIHDIVWAYLDNHTMKELEKKDFLTKSIEKAKKDYEKLFSHNENLVNDYNGYNEETLKSQLYFSLMPLNYNDNIEEKMYAYAKRLPLSKNIHSGIIAVHSKCYHSLTKEEQENLPFSKNDPNQSWGRIRKKYK